MKNNDEEVVEGLHYPWADPRYLIEKKNEYCEWLIELVKNTIQDLPEPNPERKRKQLDLGNIPRP